MGIFAVARGEVVAEPATVTTDAGTATVMVVRDCGAAGAGAFGVADAGGPRGDWLTDCGGVEYEVSCRRVGLARRVLTDLVVGDRVVVVGSVHLDPVAGPVEDPASMARVSLEAVLVGWDLDS